MTLSEARTQMYQLVRSTVSAALTHMFLRRKASNRDEDSLWRIKRWTLTHLEPHYIGDSSTRTYRQNKFRYRCLQKTRRYRRAYGEIVNVMLRDEPSLTALISEVATRISLGALGSGRSK